MCRDEAETVDGDFPPEELPEPEQKEGPYRRGAAAAALGMERPAAEAHPGQARRIPAGFFAARAAADPGYLAAERPAGG